MDGESIRLSFLPLIRTHVLLIVDRAVAVQDNVPEFVHQCERLTRLPVLLFYNDNRATFVVNAEPKDRTILGDLPFTSITVALKNQHPPTLNSMTVRVKSVDVPQL